jgi:hypothetical protein
MKTLEKEMLKLQCDCCRSIFFVSRKGQKSNLFQETKEPRCPACYGYLSYIPPEKHYAQIINNSAIRNTCEEKFPHLWKEVTERDQYSSSSWYELSDEAYEEWERWQKA